MGPFLRVALAVLAWAALPACNVERPTTLRLDVRTAQDANAGRHFFLLVRKVEERQFLIDNYDYVARLVFGPTVDESVLQVLPIVPGKRARIDVKRPEDGSVAVYALFTEPSGQWKTLVAPPFGDIYRFRIEDARLLLQARPLSLEEAEQEDEDEAEEEERRKEAARGR